MLPLQRIRPRLRRSALSLAVLACAAFAHAGEHPGCGAGALIDLAATIGCPLGPAQEAQLVARYPAGRAVSMLELTLAAADLGVELRGVEATVQELRSVRGPAIVHLAKPDHFVTLLLRDDTHCQISDNGQFTHLSWDDFATRYSGQALILPDDAQAGPKLRVTPVLLPGATPGTQAQVREVVIANEGSEELSVSLLRTNCDCLTVVPNSLAVPPHGTQRLVIEVLPEKPATTYYATFVSDDPRWQRFALECRVNIPRRVVIDPRTASMTVRKGAGATRVFRVGAPADAGIVGVRTGSPILTCSEPTDNTKPAEAWLGLRAWHIAVSLTPEAPPGAMEATLQVLTTVDGAGVAEAEVSIEVQPDLRCIPERVFLGALKLGEKAETRLSVLHRDGKPFALAAGAQPVAGLSAQIGDWAAGRREVLVSLTPHQPGILRTELVLTTDVPQEERLVIPVYAEVR